MHVRPPRAPEDISSDRDMEEPDTVEIVDQDGRHDTGARDRLRRWREHDNAGARNDRGALATIAVRNAMLDAELKAFEIDGMLSYQSNDSVFSPFVAGAVVRRTAELANAGN
jgi:hypothetical protein